MSLFWMEDLYELIRWRKRNRIGNAYRVILGGNHAMCYPNTVVSFVDGVYSGDGSFGTERLMNLLRKPPESHWQSTRQSLRQS